jgi:hypothetical protein
MKNPLQIRIPDLPAGRLLKILLSIFILIIFCSPSFGQKTGKKSQDSLPGDTIRLKKGTRFLYEGKNYKARNDTVFIMHPVNLPTTEEHRVEQSNAFYDSIYQKFSRKRFSQLLYGLAFKPQVQNSPQELPDKIKSESPFEQYKGNVIRHIRIISLDPFGTSTLDTLEDAKTGIGNALNIAHIKTNHYVIRKNLFFKEGQRVDPFLLADNERNLREMSFIDNVMTYVVPVDPGNDSVDITIVTKDVWSIGFDVLTATTKRVTMRLYDGNFLGLADRLSTNFSFKTRRAPFFRFDGASYTWNNIAGIFLNTSLNYLTDDLGNETIGLTCTRDFYSIKTRWAGGVGFQYYKWSNRTDNNDIENKNTDGPSYLHDLGLWAGHAVPLKHARIPSRIVIMESFFRRTFTARPPVTINDHKSYYDITRLLTGIGWSGNSTYLSDYMVQLGKTENIAYGHFIKFTAGPEITTFYTRLYSSIDLSAGDFITGFGYFSGRAVTGGYFYRGSFEDALFKVSMNYITPLFQTQNHKFKFRNFLFADYRYGFNSRTNNKDYTDINQDLRIDQVQYDSVFFGKKSLATSLSAIMYTPLYFYGFRFAFSILLKGGFIAPEGESLFHQPFYSGFGLGIQLRNENLIFPLFQLSCFYYPSVPHGVPWFQYRFEQNASLSLPDFNITSPQAESLRN